MRWLRLGIGVSLAFFLSSCSLDPTKTLELKQTEVSNYNTLVSNTLDAYVKVRSYAEDRKDDLLKYILEDSNTLGLDIETSLTDEELSSFKNYSILYDNYFVSLGADSLREVLVIVGGSKTMFVTVVWSDDKVEWVSRKVEG